MRMLALVSGIKSSSHGY